MVTSVNPASDGGFITAWECDSVNEPLPGVSVLNYNEGWSATPSSITQKLVPTGHLCVCAYKATDVVTYITDYVS